jgi:hypothetical protein
MKPSLLGRWEE